MDPGDIKVIIAAGGKGTRLFPETEKTPKPMLKVGGKPVLEHILKMFVYYGFRNFIFSVGYKKESIIEYFGNGSKFGVKIDYVKEDENNLLGNAYAISEVKNLLKSTFIVTFGDILRYFDILKMVRYHKMAKSLGTLNLYKKRADEATSIVEFDKNRNITSFIEKPEIASLSTEFIWESSSFFILEPELLSFFPKGVFLDFGRDVIPPMISNGVKLKAYITDDYLIDVGTSENFKQADSDIRSGKLKL